MERIAASVSRFNERPAQLPAVLGRRSAQGARQRRRPGTWEVSVDVSDRTPPASPRRRNRRTGLADRLRYQRWRRGSSARRLSERVGSIDARTAGDGLYPGRAGIQSRCEAVPNGGHRSPSSRRTRCEGNELLVHLRRSAGDIELLRSLYFIVRNNDGTGTSDSVPYPSSARRPERRCEKGTYATKHSCRSRLGTKDEDLVDRFVNGPFGAKAAGKHRRAAGGQFVHVGVGNHGDPAGDDVDVFVDVVDEGEPARLAAPHAAADSSPTSRRRDPHARTGIAIDDPARRKWSVDEPLVGVECHRDGRRSTNGETIGDVRPRRTDRRVTPLTGNLDRSDLRNSHTGVSAVRSRWERGCPKKWGQNTSGRRWEAYCCFPRSARGPGEAVDERRPACPR